MGGFGITFHIMFKIVLICLVPSIVFRMYDKLNELREQNELLIDERKQLKKDLKKIEKDALNETIFIFSENSSEKLQLMVSNVLLINSADNYVEIVYKEEDMVKKKMIRNSMKNIEHQIGQYTSFIRCHRTFIININYVDNLKRKLNNHWLRIIDYYEMVPVSRHYLLQIKEAIKINRDE